MSTSSEWVEKLPPVEVAKAALCEAGRVDLAEQVHANRAGWPSIWHGDEDHDVIVRAFYLAHRSTGHRCRIAVGDTDGRPMPGIHCDDCLESHR